MFINNITQLHEVGYKEIHELFQQLLSLEHFSQHKDEIIKMPFIGQDWRSPGDQWVRTSEGWERMRLWRVKIFENLNENAVARIIRLALEDSNNRDLASRRQPYILFNSGSSKEKLELTSLSEALVRLDMAGAVRDIKRANFVYRLLVLIMETKFPSLSGSSQKLFMNIVESMVNEALKSELNIGMMKDLLGHAKNALQEGKHSHIGSQSLWTKHTKTVDRLSNEVAEYQIKERNKDGKMMLSDLPTDCLRVIFSQIHDHRDVLRAGQTSLKFNEVTEESVLWKQMCLFHFTNRQMMTFLPSQSDATDIDWKYIYKRSYKRFGKKEVYADMLALCSHCCSIYWQSLGHPCISEETFKSKVLAPEDFMDLFKL